VLALDARGENLGNVIIPVGDRGSEKKTQGHVIPEVQSPLSVPHQGLLILDGVIKELTKFPPTG
jgi:hypothetical protein